MSELRAIAAELRALVERLEQAAGPAVDGETLTDWATRWFEQRRSAGREREWRIFLQHVAPTLGAKAVAALTRDDVSGWPRSWTSLLVVLRRDQVHLVPLLWEALLQERLEHGLVVGDREQRCHGRDLLV